MVHGEWFYVNALPQHHHVWTMLEGQQRLQKKKQLHFTFGQQRWKEGMLCAWRMTAKGCIICPVQHPGATENTGLWPASERAWQGYRGGMNMVLCTCFRGHVSVFYWLEQLCIISINIFSQIIPEKGLWITMPSSSGAVNLDKCRKFTVEYFLASPPRPPRHLHAFVSCAVRLSGVFCVCERDCVALCVFA